VKKMLKTIQNNIRETLSVESEIGSRKRD